MSGESGGAVYATCTRHSHVKDGAHGPRAGSQLGMKNNLHHLSQHTTGCKPRDGERLIAYYGATALICSDSTFQPQRQFTCPTRQSRLCAQGLPITH